MMVFHDANPSYGAVTRLMGPRFLGGSLLKLKVSHRIHGTGIFTWVVLSDEQMSKKLQFSLLNDEQMSNWVGVKHLPVTYIYIP